MHDRVPLFIWQPCTNGVLVKVVMDRSTTSMVRCGFVRLNGLPLLPGSFDAHLHLLQSVMIR
jgi:hypothetical protein